MNILNVSVYIYRFVWVWLRIRFYRTEPPRVEVRSSNSKWFMQGGHALRMMCMVVHDIEHITY